LEFLAPLRDQFIFGLHLWPANVKREGQMNSLKAGNIRLQSKDRQ
jgi:hypothetical protein